MTLVCFALAFESEAFRRIIRHRKDVSVVITGMGRDSAVAEIRAAVLRLKPCRILAAGFCGSLDPDLRVGDAVIGSNVSSPDAIKDLPTGLWRVGEMLMTNSVVCSADAKRDLWVSTGALTVDMESTAIYAAVAEFKIPILTLRVVSDDAGRDLVVPGEILAGAAEGGFLGVARLIGWLIRNPGKWILFARFVRDSSIAQNRLARSLNQLIR